MISSRGNKPHELRFHREYSDVQKDGDAFIIKGKTSLLRAAVLTPGQVAVGAEDIADEDGREGGAEFKMFTLRLQKNARIWRNATSF